MEYLKPYNCVQTDDCTQIKKCYLKKVEWNIENIVTFANIDEQIKFWH